MYILFFSDFYMIIFIHNFVINNYRFVITRILTWSLISHRSLGETKDQSIIQFREKQYLLLTCVEK